MYISIEFKIESNTAINFQLPGNVSSGNSKLLQALIDSVYVTPIITIKLCMFQGFLFGFLTLWFVNDSILKKKYADDI